MLDSKQTTLFSNLKRRTLIIGASSKGNMGGRNRGRRSTVRDRDIRGVDFRQLELTKQINEMNHNQIMRDLISN